MLKKKNHKTKYCIIGLGVVGSIFVFTFFVYFSYQSIEQYLLLDKIESRYGAYIYGGYVQINGHYEEALMIDPRVRGSAFDVAGIRTGEIVVHPSGRFNSFLKFLDQPSGTELEIKVTDGDPGPELYKRPMRTVKFIAP